MEGEIYFRRLNTGLTWNCQRDNWHEILCNVNFIYYNVSFSHKISPKGTVRIEKLRLITSSAFCNISMVEKKKFGTNS